MSLARIDDMSPATISERAKQYAQESRTPATWKAYASDWKAFEGFCQSQSLSSLPASPQTVAAFLTVQSDICRPSTLERRLASISVRHKNAGHPSPCNDPVVLSVLQGIRRDKGTRPTKKRPLRVEDLRKVVSKLEANPLDQRNRAMILLGYAGGFRRSELVALDWNDIEFVSEGAKVLVRRSKTDQTGKGLLKFIPFGSSPQTCPIRSLGTWQKTQSFSRGPVFTGIDRWGNLNDKRLTPKAVALTVKRLTKEAGLDDTEYAAHSLRSGLVTDGYAFGVAESDIAAMTGHKSRAVLESYRQEADGFKRNVAGSVGL